MSEKEKAIMRPHPCWNCQSPRHYSCERSENPWVWTVMGHDGWTYGVDRFGGDLYEISKERTVGAYGGLEYVARDMERIAKGDIPIECPTCEGSGMDHSEPFTGGDCPNCNCGTRWTEPAP